MREWLIEKREVKKMSQVAVAEKVGITQACYGAYETGIRRPSPEVAKKLGKLLKFNWTKFYS